MLLRAEDCSQLTTVHAVIHSSSSRQRNPRQKKPDDRICGEIVSRDE